jgi:hypothetical protein
MRSRDDRHWGWSRDGGWRCDQDFDRDSNTIEVFVGRLRKKLGVDIIQTVRGLGYRMEPPGQGATA